MSNHKLPGPPASSPMQQHLCSAPESIAALRDAIELDSSLQELFVNRHILTIKDFDARLLSQIFRLAASYELGEAPGRVLEGKILGNVYFNETREHTFLASTSAWKRLGGETLDFDQYVDEMSLKRYMQVEFAEICNAYCDILALRTPDSETFEMDLDYFTIPVINLGNGEDLHPTLAISELYTIFKWRPDLLQESTISGERLRIAISGNPATTRAIRSFLHGVAQYPWAIEKITIVGRNAFPLDGEQKAYLHGAGLHIEYAHELYPKESMMGAVRKVLPETDVGYFYHPYSANTARMNLVDAYSSLKQDALLLNPQIQNEMTTELLKDSPHNCHCAQLRGSLYIRMALFALIFGKV